MRAMCCAKLSQHIILLPLMYVNMIEWNAERDAERDACARSNQQRHVASATNALLPPTSVVTCASCLRRRRARAHSRHVFSPIDHRTIAGSVAPRARGGFALVHRTQSYAQARTRTHTHARRSPSMRWQQQRTHCENLFTHNVAGLTGAFSAAIAGCCYVVVAVAVAVAALSVQSRPYRCNYSKLYSWMRCERASRSRHRRSRTRRGPQDGRRDVNTRRMTNISERAS